MRSWIALAVLAVVLGAGAEAVAQQEPSVSGVKLAQDLVEEGRNLGQQGRWADALERFQRAASVSQKNTPQLAFYVGYAEARVGKLVAAQVDLRRAVELARAGNNAQVLKAAEAELPELEARTPALTITAEAGAASGLTVDGAALGVAALGNPVPLDPGEHTVVVRFSTGEVTRRVNLVERQRATLSIDGPEARATAPVPVSAPPPPSPVVPGLAVSPAPEGAGSARKTLGVVAVAAGGASLAAAGVFAALSRSAFSPVSSACPSSPCTVPSDSPLPSDYDDARNKQTVAIVLASAGGAIAAAGLVLLLTGGSGERAPHAASASPWIGPGGGGAWLGGHF